MATDQGMAAKLRAMADGMVKTIEEKRRPMTQNPTPKRVREYDSRRLDGDNLDRGRKAILALADAYEQGAVPDVLRALKTKASIIPLVRFGFGSTGYYSVHSTGQYVDKSPQGIALQLLLDSAETEAQKQERLERERLAKIEAAEAKVRFVEIDGFFPTPKPIIEQMIELADLKPGMVVLEPSAGKGDIADNIRDAGFEVHCIERNYGLVEILRLKGHTVIGSDFMVDNWFIDGHYTAHGMYDRVVQNPPFEYSQDIEHVYRAFRRLKRGGRLVSIVSSGPFFRWDSKAVAFRAWLEALGAEIIDLPGGSFNGPDAFRRTVVAAKIVVIDNLSEACADAA